LTCDRAELIEAPMSFPAGPRFTVENRRPADYLATEADMDHRLELVLIPVSDVDRAKNSYLDAGFGLIVDTAIGEDTRVVQVNPPGSECSIGFGPGLTSAEAGQ
jgi:hypothetical protein